MNKTLVFIIGTLIILGGIVFYLLQSRNDGQIAEDLTPTITQSVTPGNSPTLTVSDDEQISWDMFVEAVEDDRVGFMNARILLVNEGHVVQTIYITDDTQITGDDITIDTLEELEPGTPVRIIGSPTEGGVLAQELIINPENHAPTPQLP